MNYCEKIIYLAGIVDGEGCIRLNYHKKTGQTTPRFEVSNTSKELIDWLYDNFGGHICPVVRKGNRKLQYHWYLHKNEMKLILPQIFPYLIVKKSEAKILANYIGISL